MCYSIDAISAPRLVDKIIPYTVISMKTLFLLLAVAVATTFAEYSLVETQIHAIINANPSITEAECIQKCDDSFGLLDPIEEAKNDAECADECHCHITNPLCDAPAEVSKSSTLNLSLFTVVLSTIFVISLQFV